MSTLTALLVGVVAILGIAKLNHSNKLFWTLLVSMLLGFAVKGSISYSYKHNKSNDATYVIPMQGSTTLTATSLALLPDTRTIEFKNKTYTLVKPVSQYNVYRDIALVYRILNSFNPENDIGIIEPINTS